MDWPRVSSCANFVWTPSIIIFWVTPCWSIQSSARLVHLLARNFPAHLCTLHCGTFCVPTTLTCRICLQASQSLHLVHFSTQTNQNTLPPPSILSIGCLSTKKWQISYLKIYFLPIEQLDLEVGLYTCTNCRILLMSQILHYRINDMI